MQAESKQVIREFLIENMFNGNDNGELTDDTPLISSRLMDSIIALKLVTHLEEKFGIEFEAEEVDQDNLDTINKLSAFVQKKMK
jgi:acyl carrier protein